MDYINLIDHQHQDDHDEHSDDGPDDASVHEVYIINSAGRGGLRVKIALVAQPSWVISTVTNISELPPEYGAAQRGDVAVVAAVADADVLVGDAPQQRRVVGRPNSRTTIPPTSGTRR